MVATKTAQKKMPRKNGPLRKEKAFRKIKMAYREVTDQQLIEKQKKNSWMSCDITMM